MKNCSAPISNATGPRSRHLLAAVLIATTIAALAGCTPETGEVTTDPAPPAAVLTEVDVPGTTPMSAAAIDLSEYGYTETEYYATGDAVRYRGAVDGSLETAEPVEGTTPYETRVLVRVPEESNFNGTLLVEWTNVTLGQDADFTFSEANESLLRDGYAYAVVSAQAVGVQRLTTWSPERYGQLTVDGDNTDPDAGGNLEECFMGAPECVHDPLSWDVMSQVSQALKNNAGDDAPLAGLTIENVIATGQSQSAARLTTYYNTIQPLANLFDGFVMWDRAGELRSDLEVPAISVNSESLTPPVSDEPSSTFTRDWDVAGASHGSQVAADYMDAMFLRDESNVGPAGPLTFTAIVEPTCDVLPPFSTVPAGLVVAGAIDAVRNWISTGTEAPASIYFTRDDTGAVVRGADGRIEGGVRLAEFAAPIAEIRANNGAAFPCSISGHHRDLSAEELTARYGTHEDYVRQVRAATEVAESGGYLLAADADATVTAAEQSTVAR